MVLMMSKEICGLQPPEICMLGCLKKNNIWMAACLNRMTSSHYTCTQNTHCLKLTTLNGVLTNTKRGHTVQYGLGSLANILFSIIHQVLC